MMIRTLRSRSSLRGRRLAACGRAGRSSSRRRRQHAALFEVPANQRARLKIEKVARKAVVRPVRRAGPRRVRCAQDQRGHAAGQRQGREAARPRGRSSSRSASRCSRSRAPTRRTPSPTSRAIDPRCAASRRCSRATRISTRTRRSRSRNCSRRGSTSRPPRPRCTTTRPTRSITGSTNGDALLLSPIEGVVVSRKVSVGDPVQSETTTVLHDHRPVRDLDRQPALPGGSAPGRARRRRADPLAGARHAAHRQGDLHRRLDRSRHADHSGPDRGARIPAALLKQGMYVDAEILPAKPETAIVVPAAAVLRDADNLPFVYVAGQARHVRAPPHRARRPGR